MPPVDTITVLPDWVWELDVTNDPSDPTEVWTDITAHVRGASWHRGRQVETGRDQAGTLSLDLDNGQGLFDFFNSPELTNLIKNPSVETNTTGYAAINGSIARSNAAGRAYSGSYGLVATTTNVNDSGWNYGGPGVLLVTPGVSYTFSCWARLASAGSKFMELLIVWLNSGGTLIGFEETDLFLDSTNYSRFSVDGTAPAGAVSARVALQTKITGLGIFDFWSDALQFEVSAPAPVDLIDNPGIETNTLGYTTTGSGSFARSNSAGVPHSGTWGLDVTTANVSDSGVKYQTSGPITAGLIHTFQVWARLASAGSKTMALYIDWYDDGSNFLTEDYQPFLLNSTTYSRFALQGTAPPGASFAQIYVITEGAGLGIFHFYLDDLEFVPALHPNQIENPSLETNATGYSGTAATVARSNAAGVPYFGSWGLDVTTTNVINSAARYTPPSPIVVTPGQAYTFSAYARLASAGSKAMGIWISWLDATGAYITASYQPFTLNALTFAQFGVTGSAPPNAHQVSLSVETDAAGLGVFHYYLDGLSFSIADSPTAYIDGSLPGGFWSGTAHASETYRGYPNLKPMRRVRGRATWPSTTYPLFYGYLDDPLQDYPGFQDAITRVTATDAFKLLNKKLVSLDLPRQRSDVRIAALLDEAGFPAGKRDLSVGVTTCDAIILDGVSALEHIQQVAESESGRFFISAAGDATFIDRHAAYLTTSQATFGEQEINYKDVQFGGGESLIYNEVLVQRAADGSVQQSADDATSQAEFMPRTLSFTGQHMDSDNEASDKAKFWLALLKDYHPRIVKMDLEGVYQPNDVWPQALGRELGDRLTVRKRPPNAPLIEQESFIEWVEHRVGVGTWEVSIGLTTVGIGFQLYPNGGGFFILGDATYGVLTTGPGVLVY